MNAKYRQIFITFFCSVMVTAQAHACLEASSLDMNFGAIGSSDLVRAREQTLSIKNTHTGPVQIRKVTQFNDVLTPEGVFSSDLKSPMVISGKGTLAATVTFSPGPNRGIFHSELFILYTCNGMEQAQVVLFQGAAGDSDIRLQDLRVPPWTVGSTQTGIEYLIRNEGLAPAEITEIKTNFTLDFDVQNQPSPANPLVIPGMSTGSVKIKFSPHVTGLRTARISIQEKNGSIKTANLYGQGTNLDLYIDTPSISFLPVEVGTDCLPMTLSVYNQGHGGVNLSSLVTTNDSGSSVGTFSYETWVPRPIQPSDKLDVKIGCHLDKVGTLKGRIFVFSDVLSTLPVRASLTATGIDPSISVDQTELVFEDALVRFSTSVIKSFVVKNSSTVPVSLIFHRAQEEGSKGSFRWSEETLLIPPLGTSKISVTFLPTQTGLQKLALEYKTASGKVFVFRAQGTGLSPEGKFERSEIEFDPISILGTSSYRNAIFTNTGTTILDGIILQKDDPYSLFEVDPSFKIPGSISPKGTIQIPVRFRPRRGSFKIPELNSSPTATLRIQTVNGASASTILRLASLLPPEIKQSFSLQKDGLIYSGTVQLTNQANFPIEGTISLMNQNTPDWILFDTAAVVFDIAPGETKSFPVKTAPRLAPSQYVAYAAISFRLNSMVVLPLQIELTVPDKESPAPSVPAPPKEESQGSHSGIGCSAHAAPHGTIGWAPLLVFALALLLVRKRQQVA